MDLYPVFIGFVLMASLVLANASDIPFGPESKLFKSDSPHRAVAREPHYCHSYNTKHSRKDIPCTNEDLDENGVCNMTQKCDMNNEKGSHCFMSWKNESGKVQVISSGCWIPNGECDSKKECRAFNNSANNGVYFCCCEVSLCNSKFYLDLVTHVQDVDRPELEPEVFNQWLLLPLVLGPLFIGCVIFIIIFWLYRRRKVALDEMEFVSVDTPATGTTHCTLASFSPVAEMTLPQLIDMKARGRFGKVWRAQYQDNYVAVKTFELHQRMSWQNEQDIFMTPLMGTHDNILKFLTATRRGEGNETELWLITEFYERGSLADYLKSYQVTLPEVLCIIRSMASGMSFLHEDIQHKSGDYKPAIAHRDFKSKNVLLDQNLNAVIADFGLAVKFTPGESPGESHGQVGTLRYMAPEVLEGAINFQKDAFLRIDMYAFGLVMWEILTRCNVVDVGEALLPFEPELGTHPSMDDLQDHVVEKKLRPKIKQEWRNIKQVLTICDTMEECWDHDAEARLSAGCVELRISSLQRQQANNRNIDANIQAMNQLNTQISNSTHPTNPISHPIGAPDKIINQHMVADQPSHITTPLISQGSNSIHLQMRNEEEGFLPYKDEDHDSGTYASDPVNPLLGAHSSDVSISDGVTQGNDQGSMSTSLL